MSATPSRKRKRTVSQTDSSEKDTFTTRSPHIYLEDGNVVLVAENVAFRVHKSQLARHSEVFRDMFTLVNQPMDTEVFDGCPVVRLSDSAYEARMLLQALYDNTQFDSKNPQVIGILQMSSKYLIEPLRLSATKYLRQVYPDTLVEWDTYTDKRAFSHSILVIQLVNADILLPAAYYYLCAYPLDEILQCRPKLPPHLFEAYCRGKEHMAGKLADFVDRHILGHERSSLRNPACLDAWESMQTGAYAYLRHQPTIKGPRPLHALLRLSQKEWVSQMCRECRSKLEESVRKEREAIWESLPEAFGLRPWKELRKII